MNNWTKQKKKKRLRKIVEKSLYYAGAINPTMLMAVNSLAVVQKKPTTETAKQISQLLNDSAAHRDEVTEYRRSGMIFHIYSDASYISEPEARSRASGYLFLGTKSRTPIQAITLENGPVHVECSIMRNVMASATEAELGG